jgi:hypothetical protein
MACEQLKPQSIRRRDQAPEPTTHQGETASSTPPASVHRTFRLSEIPLDIKERALCKSLNRLRVGNTSIKRNSEVFSLATYRSWQVATVSFQQEPDDFKRCTPDHKIYIRLSKRRTEGRAVPVNIAVDCDFYGMTPLYQPKDAAPAKYE